MPTRLPRADRRPSVRVATGAWLVRHGCDPAHVGPLTRVPFALLQLLAQSHDRPRRPVPAPAVPEPSWHYVDMSRPWASLYVDLTPPS